MRKGVVDRVVDEIAVVLVEEEGLEFELPVTRLPDEAEEGVWLSLEVEDGRVASVELDQEGSEERRERVESKLERLRERDRKSSERVD